MVGATAPEQWVVGSAGLRSAFDGVGGVPYHGTVDPVRVALDDRLVQVLGVVGALCGGVEVPQVAAGFVDVVRAVFGAVRFVAGDHRGRLQRADGVEGGQPSLDAAVTGLGEVEVDVVVDRVTGDGQTERGHVQRGGVVGIGMA